MMNFEGCLLREFRSGEGQVKSREKLNGQKWENTETEDQDILDTGARRQEILNSGIRDLKVVYINADEGLRTAKNQKFRDHKEEIKPDITGTDEKNLSRR